jgi:hypothetical protein
MLWAGELEDDGCCEAKIFVMRKDTKGLGGAKGRRKPVMGGIGTV